MRITAHRVIDTVLAIPVGETVSTADVVEHLELIGYEISKRSVERDLASLDGKYGIVRVGKAEWVRKSSLDPQ